MTTGLEETTGDSLFLPVALTGQGPSCRQSSRPGMLVVSLLGNKKERAKISSWNGCTLCKSLHSTVEVHSPSLPSQPPGHGSEGFNGTVLSGIIPEL